MHGLVSAPEMFRAQAARSPAAPAVRDGNRELDYRELDDRSTLLAQSLVARGIGRGHLVAVVLDRSPELVVALVAVLRAGAAYVPISPDDPADRVGFLLRDARPSLVITSARHAQSFPWLDPGLLHLVDDAAAPTASGPRSSAPAALPSVTPSDAAYVIYTSGSSGRPKGVVVEHGALSAYLGHVTAHYPSVAGRALLHSSVSFDMAVTSLYGPLVTGGVVDLVDLRTIGAQASPSTGGESPSFLKVTPSHLALLGALPDWCSPTDHLVIGGEALTAEQLTPWWDEHRTVIVVNEYGPTEATVGCCVYQARWDGPVDGPHVPIGGPIGGVRLYVLDHRLKQVPAGDTGELHIAGPQLARGYLGRPTATATAFLADPFGPPGERMYRTGDLVRQRPDGNLEFLGRADDQIKVNGYRIEPGEIQAVLTGHDLVAQAFVTLRGRDTESPRLTAFVVPAEGAGRLDPDALRAFVASRLPEHMVPVDFVPLPALPLTANGKVDQRALPAPGARDTGGDSTATAAGSVEGVLCRMVVDLTGARSAGIDDDFFQLGGSSIAAARLVTRARREGIGLTLATVLKGRTVRRMLALQEGS